MEDALHYMKVQPSKDQLNKDYRLGEKPVVEVPNLVGATVQDIYEDLNSDFNLVKSGSGNVVVSQAPKPGTRVDRGSTIRVYLSNPTKPDGSENKSP